MNNIFCSVVDVLKKCEEIHCHEESYNGNQKEYIKMEEPKKDEWMEGLRWRTSKHGLIEKDAK
jgi:hypothetical protein